MAEVKPAPKKSGGFLTQPVVGPVKVWHVILIGLIALVAYYLYKKKSAAGTADGAACTDVNGNASTYLNGVCQLAGSSGSSSSGGSESEWSQLLSTEEAQLTETTDVAKIEQNINKKTPAAAAKVPTKTSKPSYDQRDYDVLLAALLKSHNHPKPGSAEYKALEAEAKKRSGLDSTPAPAAKAATASKDTSPAALRSSVNSTAAPTGVAAGSHTSTASGSPLPAATGGKQPTPAKTTSAK